MHGQAPLSPITGVPGWESPDEQRLLLEMAQTLSPGSVIVEIGSEFGMSASLFRKGSSDETQVYCVDLFPNGGHDYFQGNLMEAGLFMNVFILKGDSARMGKAWGQQRPIKLIDLLFVDGDHSYQGVKRDIEAWTPYVKRGGLILFHDTACPTNRQPHALHHMVSKAINEWQEGQPEPDELITTVDSISVYRRVLLCLSKI